MNGAATSTMQPIIKTANHTVLLYLIMYLLMFSGAIYLRYNMKKAPRPFRIGRYMIR